MKSKWRFLVALSMLFVLTLSAVSYADSFQLVRLNWGDRQKVESAYLDEGLYQLTIINDSVGRRDRGCDLEFTIEQRDRRGRDRDTVIQGKVNSGDTTQLKLRLEGNGRYDIGLNCLEGRSGKGEFRVEKIRDRGNGRG